MDRVRNLTTEDLGIVLRDRRLPTQAEDDLILAALRLWQNVEEGCIVLVFPDGGPCGLDYFEDVATNAGLHPMPTTETIDVLLDEVYAVV
jgi:hypothetical protein